MPASDDTLTVVGTTVDGVEGPTDGSDGNVSVSTTVTRGPSRAVQAGVILAIGLALWWLVTPLLNGTGAADRLPPSDVGRFGIRDGIGGGLAAVRAADELDSTPATRLLSLDRDGEYDGRLYFLPAPPLGTTIVPDITSLEDGNLVARTLGEPLPRGRGFDAYPGQPGERREVLLPAPAGLVIVTSGQIRLLDHSLEGGIVDLGPGLAAMLAPDRNSLWVFSSAERMVRRVDLLDLTSGPELLLADVGRPLAAVGDGLLLSTSGREESADLAYWTEDGTLTPLTGTGGMELAGAAGERVVLWDGARLSIYDLGDLESARLLAGPAEMRTSTLSPGGRYLAHEVTTALAVPNRIEILDLETGQRVDSIENTLGIGYQWSEEGRLLYMRPDWPTFTLVERDIRTTADLELVFFPDLSWLYAGVR